MDRICWFSVATEFNADSGERAARISVASAGYSVRVVPHGDGWRATAHVLGRRVVGDGGDSGVEDGDAGVWCNGWTPGSAAAGAIEAWREAARRRREDAERAEASAREAAEGWRRLCAEVGA